MAALFVSLFAILNSEFAVAQPGQIRLMVISVDGLRPDAISAGLTPNLYELQVCGARAGVAINDLPSMTLPNHATILTGLTSDHHGVNFNFEVPGEISAPTLLDYAYDGGYRCAFFATKGKLKYLAHQERLEYFFVDGSTRTVMAELLPVLTADGPDVIFMHFRDPDSNGHAAGWMSDQYLEAVRWTDEFVQQIRDAVAADISRPTYIILTADHGGSDTNHFLNTSENREIPWIVVGPDIPSGLVLDEAVANVDTTPTALWLLGLRQPDRLDGTIRVNIKETDAAARFDGRFSVAPVGIPCVLFAAPTLVAALWVSRRVSSDVR